MMHGVRCFIAIAALAATPLVSTSQTLCEPTPSVGFPEDGGVRQPPLFESGFFAFGDYLAAQAERLDFAYTFEDAMPEKNGVATIACRRDFDRRGEYASIEEFISHVESTLLGVRILRSDRVSDSRVLHFIDARLAGKDYVLDQYVAFDRYEGPIALLPSYLSTLTEGRVCGWSVGVPPDRLWGDDRTDVAVSADAETVRDVLTQAVPRQGYRRLLWQAAYRSRSSITMQVLYSSSTTPKEFSRHWKVRTADYLARMAEELNFHYTIEERFPGGWNLSFPQQDVPQPKVDFESIDDFVAHANATIPGVRFVRNETFPSVVHAIAQSSLVDGYVLDRKISLRFDGLLKDLPDRLAEITGRELIPDPGRYWTDREATTKFEAADRTVRDVLTAAAPLTRDRRLVWKASVSPRRKEAHVDYVAPLPTREKRILQAHHVFSYLQEMGSRLDCRFTLEDDGDAEQTWRRWIETNLAQWDPDFEIETIEDLVVELETAFNREYVWNGVEYASPYRMERVRVVRSARDPRVIHLIDARLPRTAPGNALERRIDFGFWGRLRSVPEEIGKQDRRVVWDETREIAGEFGEDLPSSKTYVVDATIRDVLTLASPPDPNRVVLWRATSKTIDGKPTTLVRYFGVRRDVAERLRYWDGDPLWTEP